MPRQGVLLVNLGSPASPSVPDVRRYLREFLTDERVIDVPFVRRVIVPQIILRTRPKKSAAAYASIWTAQGSPLLVISRRQQALLQDALPDVHVALAMRYGEPAIAPTLEAMVARGVEHLFLLPLYPHYAMSSYETVVARVFAAARGLTRPPRIDILQPFYADADYIDALATVTAPHLTGSWDRLLFSFHGVPVRHLVKGDPSHAHCTQVADCCQVRHPAHATCYRHQCVTTAEALARRLGIAPDRYFISFQSRLGSDPWLEPYTDATLERFGREGVRRVRVICPAFVTDCLETLEEIAEAGKERFLHAGGDDFALIPCLNDHPAFIAFLRARVDAWRAQVPAPSVA